MILVDECSVCFITHPVSELTKGKCRGCYLPIISLRRKRNGEVYRLMWAEKRTLARQKTHKTCKGCGQVKLINDFRKQTAALDGHQTKCRICAIKDYKAWKKKAYGIP